MKSVIILAPIAVLIGYIYCIKNIRQKNRLYRFRDKALYLHCSVIGCIFLAAGAVINASVYLVATRWLRDDASGYYYVYHLSDLLEVVGIDSNIYGAWTISTGIIAFCLAWVVASIVQTRAQKRKLDAEDNLDKTIEWHNEYQNVGDNAVVAMILKSFLSDQLLMFSLADRRVYVGKVTRLQFPTISQPACQEILVAPILSGYRDEKQQVLFKSDYLSHDIDGHNTDDIDARIDEYLMKPEQIVSLAFKREDIKSVTVFSFDMYKAFNHEQLAVINTDSGTSVKPR